MKNILIALTLLISSLAFGQGQPARGELMPVGAIQAFGHANGTGLGGCPSGWIPADGSPRATASYPALDAAFATTWGARSGGNFQTPNLNGQGRYLRGGTPGTMQAEGTKKNGLTVSGGTASLTGTTTFGTSSHTHPAGGLFAALSITSGGQLSMNWISPTFPITYKANVNTPGSTTGTSGDSTAVMGDTGAAGASGTVGISSTAASLGAGDSETRPITAVVLYCIKT